MRMRDFLYRNMLSLMSLTLLGATLAQVQAQRPAVCGPGASMQLKCQDACIICDIDGFQGRNNNGGQLNEGDLPQDFCTSVNHNIQWIGFLAGSAQLTIELSVSNCQNGNRPDGGLEAGIFEVTDCNLAGARRMSNCDSDIPNGSTQVFTMETLVPGNYYYLVIDGNNGDICDYSVRTTRGTTRVPVVTSSGGLRGPRQVCRGRDFVYTTSAVGGAAYYDWTLDGAPIGSEDDLEQTLTFSADGSYQLCVTASNLCNTGPQECLTIHVGDLSPTRVSLSSCDNTPISVNGRTFTTSGVFPVLLRNRVGCDSSVTYDVRIQGRLESSWDTTICAGKTLRFDGRDLSAAGTYTTILSSSTGCDSTVTLRLQLQSCGYVFGATAQALSCAGADDGQIAAWVEGPGAPYTLRYRAVGAPGYTSLALPPDGTQIILPDLAPGDYELLWRDVYAAEERLVVTVASPAALTVQLRADVKFGGFEVSCPGAADGDLTAEVAGGTAPYTYSWSDSRVGPNITNLTAGAYTLSVIDANGCRQNSTYTLREPLPIPETQVQLATCANEPVVLGGTSYQSSGVYRVVYRARSGCDSAVVYQLTVHPTAATQLDSTICEGWTVDFFGRSLRNSGVYQHTLSTVNGCDSVITLRLMARSCAYQVLAKAVPVACAGDRTGIIEVAVEGSEPTYDLRWRSRVGSLSGALVLSGDATPVSIGNLPAGDYLLEVEDVFGVQKNLMTQVLAPPPLRVTLASDLRGSYDISCAGAADGRLLANAQGGTPPYRYAWSTGAGSAQVAGLAAGPVSVTLTDAHGCEQRQTMTLRQPEPINYEAAAYGQGCDPATEPGGVRIRAVSGGQSPYIVRVDGGPDRRGFANLELAPGQHQILLRDKNGCSSEQAIFVDSLQVPVLQPEPTARLSRGQSTALRVRYFGNIVSYHWSGESSLSCTMCPTPTVSPVETSSYTIEVTGVDGCTARAELRVPVGVNPTLFVPSAFSPDGDGHNDGLTVFAAEAEAVVAQLSVFDRWGELLFERHDFAPNDTALGWQGTFRGERVNPGVFVYVAKVVLPEGDILETLTGEVTLLR